MSQIAYNTVSTITGLTVVLPQLNVTSKTGFDTAIIENISFVNATDPSYIFLLWCSETNGYVASFTCVGGRATLTPKVEIKLNVMSGPYVSFKLFECSLLSDPAPVLTGFMSLTLNYVKYKAN